MLHLLGLISQLALAQSIPFQNITPADFRAVTREFTANGLFSDVAGAGTLGLPFSFEVGVVAGVTNTPHVDDLTPDASVSRVPTGHAYAALALPLGLTVEGGYLPRVGAKGFRVARQGIALKWTPTELFFAAPFDVAVRAQLTRTSLQLHALVDQVWADANYEGHAQALELRVSKNLGILTPFASAGVGQGRSVMNATGALVFDPLYTRDQRETAYVKDGVYSAGLEVHLLILVAGAEYQRAFGADRFNAKVGFGF